MTRVLRALRIRQRPLRLIVQPSSGGVFLSEPWEAGARRFPGQSTYHFEDPAGNRSNPVTLTTGDVATTNDRVRFGGRELRIGPDGVAIPLPGATREIVTHHTLMAPAQDPDVVVRLLVPGGEGEHELQRAVLDDLISLDVSEDLVRAAGDGDVRRGLERLSEGFLPIQSEGWELRLGEGSSWGEQELTVDPHEPREVAVHIHGPPDGGRTSFALSVEHAADPSHRILSSLIEIDAEPGMLRIGEDLPVET